MALPPSGLTHSGNFTGETLYYERGAPTYSRYEPREEPPAFVLDTGSAERAAHAWLDQAKDEPAAPSAGPLDRMALAEVKRARKHAAHLEASGVTNFA